MPRKRTTVADLEKIIATQAATIKSLEQRIRVLEALPPTTKPKDSWVPPRYLPEKPWKGHPEWPATLPYRRVPPDLVSK